MLQYLLEKALENKDVFTTIITLLFVFAGMIPLFKWMVKQILIEIHEGFGRLSESIGKSYIQKPEEVVEMVATYIKSATGDKMAFLDERLEQNAIYEDVEGVKRQIVSRLVNLSGEHYIRPLNKRNSKLGLLGNWVNTNYPMDEFLEDLFYYFFHKTYTKRQKLSYIQKTVMPEYLNKCMDKLLHDLTK